MIRNKRNWYQFHTGNQGDLERATKEYYNFLKVIKKSKDNLPFIKHRASVSSQSKWYLIKVDIYQSDPVTMRDYGVYRCQWYIRHHKDCTKRPIVECRFGPVIREIPQYVKLGKMWTAIPLRSNDF